MRVTGVHVSIVRINNQWYASADFGQAAGTHGDMNQDTGVTEWVHTTYDVDGGDWYAAANNAPSHPEHTNWNGPAITLPPGEIQQYGMAWMGGHNGFLRALDNFQVWTIAAPCADAASGEMTVSNPPQHGTLEFVPQQAMPPISIIVFPHGRLRRG